MQCNSSDSEQCAKTPCIFDSLRKRYVFKELIAFLLNLNQMMEASLYDKIMDQQRLEPEFFRVGFYGKKFPFFLRVSE